MTGQLSVLLAAFPVAAMAAQTGVAIRFAGVPVELTLSEVSERTVRLELSPLDEPGKPRPATPSTVLVPFPATVKLQVRELAGEKEISVGQLRVLLKPRPLVVSLRRADGTRVQELVFDGAAGT